MLTRKHFVFGMCLTVIAFSFLGCSTTPKVKRVDVADVIDISGRWNDTDARVAAEKVIADAAQSMWNQQFRDSNGRKPVVIVGDILNRSHEQIDTLVVVKAFEHALLNSGQMKFVASRDERAGIREERRDQNTEGLTRPDTIKPIGQETGADFMLIGTINSVVDEYGPRSVVLYQVNMEIVDITTNEKVWFGQANIKKTVTKKRHVL
ncbi:MAG TPA: penicillin-binding protein activator LpoB [Candidatus Omnitrophota bacterium]|jgi:uncharacterized protein (TIGR02722 family)|nr:penicillin-binding protein activator LpoB [Candidatus Omnitrophota bacterium]